MDAPVVDAPPAVARGYTAETITDLSGLSSIRAEWEKLDRLAATPTFFQSYGWCAFVWSILDARPDLSDHTPRVVVVRLNGAAVLILPLALRSAFSCTICEDLTEPFAQYSDVIFGTCPDQNAALDAAWAEVKRWGTDAMILRKVRADSMIAPWLSVAGRRVGDTRMAPFVDFAAFGSFEAYRKSIKSKTRKNLRNYRNRLSRLGTLTHELVDDADERARLTRQCLEMRSAWLANSGLSSSAFQHPAFAPIIETLADGGGDAPRLQLARLRFEPNGAPPIDIAIQWGFVHNDRYYAFMSAKHPDYDGFSPGRLHLEDVIAASAARGLEVVDLLLPSMPYKTTWATGEIAVDSYGVAATLRGRAIVEGWHGLARPALKTAFMHLPTSLRRRATELDLRLNAKDKS